MQSTLAICGIMMMMFLLVEKSQATPVANAEPYESSSYSSYTSENYNGGYDIFETIYNSLIEAPDVKFDDVNLRELNVLFANFDIDSASSLFVDNEATVTIDEFGFYNGYDYNPFYPYYPNYYYDNYQDYNYYPFYPHDYTTDPYYPYEYAFK